MSTVAGATRCEEIISSIYNISIGCDIANLAMMFLNM